MFDEADIDPADPRMKQTRDAKGRNITRFRVYLYGIFPNSDPDIDIEEAVYSHLDVDASLMRYCWDDGLDLLTNQFRRQAERLLQDINWEGCNEVCDDGD